MTQTPITLTITRPDTSETHTYTVDGGEVHHVWSGADPDRDLGASGEYRWTPYRISPEQEVRMRAEKSARMCWTVDLKG